VGCVRFLGKWEGDIKRETDATKKGEKPSSLASEHPGEEDG
jgi:hypothetical protein